MKLKIPFLKLKPKLDIAHECLVQLADLKYNVYLHAKSQILCTLLKCGVPYQDATTLTNQLIDAIDLNIPK